MLQGVIVKTNAQLEALRAENVKLQSTVQQQASQAKNPFLIPTVRSALTKHQQQLQAIDSIRRGVAGEVAELMASLQVEILTTKQAFGKLKFSFSSQVCCLYHCCFECVTGPS